MIVLVTLFLALNGGPLPADPALETRARSLEAKIMAPCCWSQPVSQHSSEAATQIKTEIRQNLAAGKSEREILDSYVSRYGERILASPPFRGLNILVYLLPWVGLALGGGALAIALKRLLGQRRPSSACATPAGIPTATGYDERIRDELRQLE